MNGLRRLQLATVRTLLAWLAISVAIAQGDEPATSEEASKPARQDAHQQDLNRQSPVRHGTVHFEPDQSEQDVPAQFRLKADTFAFRSVPQPTVSKKIKIDLVTFPSPVVTPHERNNTVHCELFSPTTPGPHPGVVVLHILGGDFDLARAFARTLAHHDVAALFLKLPYYGPRQQPGVRRRMVSFDPEETVAGMTQAVLDIRRATAWMARQDEIDPDQLGVFGISLGGITSALVTTIEPRFQKACLMLAGGDVGQVAWQSKELAKLRGDWLENGGTRASFIKLFQQVDPVTYADRLGDRQVLMLNAAYDEVIPKACTDSLWESFGQPRIVWYNAGHYSAGRFMFDALAEVTEFFAVEDASSR